MQMFITVTTQILLVLMQEIQALSSNQALTKCPCRPFITATRAQANQWLQHNVLQQHAIRFVPPVLKHGTVVCQVLTVLHRVCLVDSRFTSTLTVSYYKLVKLATEKVS